MISTQYIRKFIYRINENLKSIIQNRFFFICAVVIAICALNGIYLKFNNFSSTDEFTSIAVPMVLSGQDWSDILLGMKFHGYGLTILLTPFIEAIDSGTTFYHILLSMCLLVRCITVIYTFKLLTEYWNVSNVNAAFIAFICNCGALSPSDSAELSVLQEIPLAFISVLVIYYFIKYTKTYKIRYMIVSIVVMIWGITIHSRVIIIFVAFAFMTLEYIVRERKNVKWWDVVICVLFFVGLYVCINYVNDIIIQNVFWEKDIDNSYSKVVSSKAPALLRLFDPQKVMIVLTNFFSLVISAIYYSFGFLLIFLFADVAYIYKLLESREKETNGLISAILFGFLLFIGMNMSLSAAGTGAFEQENYRFLTSIRYAKPFAWIIVMTGSTVLVNTSINVSNVCKYSILALMISVKWFMSTIVKILEKSGYELEYSCFNRYIFDASTAKGYFASISIFSFVVIFILCVWTTINKKQKRFLLLLYLFVSLIGYKSVYTYFKGRDDNLSEIYNASIDYLDTFENGEINVFYTGSIKFCQYFRFSVFKNDVNYVTQLEDVLLETEDFVIFTDQKVDVVDGLEWIQLDENEYMVVKE